ncbi:MAG: DUF507 family protein, partial [Nitrospirae bacterium]
MRLSDEKIIHMSHVLLKGLKERGVIRLKADEPAVRKRIRRSIIDEIKFGEEIDAIVRKKLSSYSKKLLEGSQEWEVLY